MGDPAEPVEPRARCAVRGVSGTPRSRRRRSGPSRNRTRRGVVLSRWRVCAAVPVARAPRRTTHGGARRQADQGRARAGPGARQRRCRMPGSASVSTTTTRTSRRRRSRSFAFLLLLPGGDRVRGCRRWSGPAKHGRAAAAAKPTTRCTGCISGTRTSRSARWNCCEALDARYPSNPIFLERIADVEHVYFHDHRAQREQLARRCSMRAADPRVASAALAQVARADRSRRRIDRALGRGRRDRDARVGHPRARHGAVRRARARGADTWRRARRPGRALERDRQRTHGRSPTRRATIRTACAHARARRSRRVRSRR